MEASRKEAEGGAVGINAINQILKTHSSKIKKTPLEDYLEGKNLLEVTQQIKTDNEGKITKLKLQEFLDEHGLEAEIQ